MARMLMPAAIAPCCCEDHAHDIRRVGDDVHYVCQGCFGSTKVLRAASPRHPTAATTPGIKGGQGHGGAELEQQAMRAVLLVAGAVLLLIAAVARG
jgi:hypothetical protein